MCSPSFRARGGEAPNEQRFPSVPWAAAMCGSLADELAAALGRGGERLRLRVGTDCAGAEAPLLALREICTTLRQSHGIEVGVDHLFSCDVNFASREFIARNTRPAALFGDLLARDVISHCLLAEAPRMVPSDMDIYVAGFPCKDFSMLNHLRPCLEGPNAAIYEGVVRYIQQHRPRAFILENVSGLMIKKKGQAESPVTVVLRTLRAIPGYQVRGWKVNTNEYWLPQNRKRVYIVGVNTDRVVLRRPLEEWGSFLKAQKGTPSEPAHSFMLPDEEPEVLAEHERALARLGKWRRRTRGALPAESHGLAHQAGRGGAAVALRHAAARRQAMAGHYGRKWVRTHQLYREKHGLPRGARSWAGLRDGWAPLMSGPRTAEVLELAAMRVERRERRDARSTLEIAEISRGIGYCSVMAKHTPCLTPTGLLWVFQRQRWLVGVEMMALQGFRPDDLDLTGLTETDLRHLAGNAMSVPVVGAFLLLLLAQVVFPREGTRAPPRGSPQHRRVS